MKWLAGHTWLIALVPLLVIILLSSNFGKPFDLLQDTDVDYLDQDSVFAMILNNDGQERAKTYRYEAKMTGGEKVLLYLQKDSLPMPKAGDVLLVQTTVKRGGILGDFNYGLYLRRQGIVGTCWAHRGNWKIIDHTYDHSLRAQAARCQNFLHHQYQSLGISGPELGILSALTLGYREDLDKTTQRSFSASGAMHVLAVSGLHTGIVWGIVIWILTLGGLRKPLWEQRWRKCLLHLSAIVIIWGYAFITGLSPSVMRNALMLTFWALASVLNQHTSHWNPLLAAAVVILLIDPLSLWSVSFQLSFAAVAGIMCIGSGIRKSISVQSSLTRYVVDLLIMSFAAQLATMPLTLHYFGQTSNYFALTNLIVVPLAGVILVLGFSTLAMSWCCIGEWLGVATEYCTRLMRLTVEWIESLPHSTTHMQINTPTVIGLYGAILCSYLMLRGDKVNWWWLIGVVGSLVSTILLS